MNKWVIWTITVLLFAAEIFAYRGGFLNYLYLIDLTYISITILSLLSGVALAASFMAFTKKYSEKLIEQLHYLVDHFTTMGMLGTTVGLFLAVKDGIPSPDSMLVNMSLALTTTIAGVVATLIGNQLMLQVERGRLDAWK